MKLKCLDMLAYDFENTACLQNGLIADCYVNGR